MAKLTKAEIKRHERALAVLDKPSLTDDDREIVFKNYHPGASFMNGKGGAFFTPWDLASDFSLELNGSHRVLDVCAGIGILSMMKYWRSGWPADTQDRLEITCVEINPAYCEIGKRLAPWANWINADIFDMDVKALGAFDAVYGNPPFGKVWRPRNGPRYKGPHTELHIIDWCAQFAPFGVFIVPQMSAPFRYSGVRCFEALKQGRGVEFQQQTGITLDVGIGVDCSIFRDQWMGASPAIEIVTADYSTARPDESARQLDLLDAA